MLHRMEVFTLPDINISLIAKDISLSSLPRKSRELYEKKYEDLMDWCAGKGVKQVTENVLLEYFSHKAKVIKSSSLWSLYSMLKATLKVKNDIDIKYFHNLVSFLKVQSVGYKPIKSKTLSQDNVSKFLLEAPDEDFLMKKVVLIFGIAGACRRDELAKLTTDDIEDRGSVLVVTVPAYESNKRRVFTIINDDKSKPTIDYLALCKKYLFTLRPEKATSNRLFLRYNKGVCSNQAVGTHTIAKIPSEIAKYLGLTEPSQYTGHCFRRTSATFLVNGGDTAQPQNDGWKSTTVGNGFLDDSKQTKNVTTQKIVESQHRETATVESQHVNVAQKSDEVISTGSGLVVQKCNNCTFNITINNTK